MSGTLLESVMQKTAHGGPERELQAEIHPVPTDRPEKIEMPNRSSMDGAPVTGRSGSRTAPTTRALRALPAAPTERAQRARRLKIGLVSAIMLIDGGLL